MKITHWESNHALGGLLIGTYQLGIILDLRIMQNEDDSTADIVKSMLYGEPTSILCEEIA